MASISHWYPTAILVSTSLHYKHIFDSQPFIRFQWFHGEVFVIRWEIEINVPSTERHCRRNG
jgi:hypothetical protein